MKVCGSMRPTPFRGPTEKVSCAPQEAGALALELAVGFLLGLGLLQRGELAFGEPQAFLRDLRLERLETLLHGLAIVPLPHAANPGRRDRGAALADLVGDPDLAEGRLLQRQLDDDHLDLGRRPVGEPRFAAGEVLERQLAAGLGELLEPGEAVARGAHHLAGWAHVAELPGEFQHAYLGADDLLVLGHSRCPLERRGRALRTPTTPRPASAHASAK